MSCESEGLPSFVQRSRQAATGLEANDKPVHAVLGNEAGDLDSMACALVVAYQLTQLNPDKMYLPLMNVPRADLKLRRDNLAAFEAAGILEEHLIFAEDLPLAELTAAKRLVLVLVDHNLLSPLQDSLGSSVVQIIDHHKDAGLYPEVAGEMRNVVFPVGSCATLVTRGLLATKKELLAEKPVNLLLQSTIAIDTSNLTDKEKTTDLDTEALASLDAESGGTEALLGCSLHDWERKLHKQRLDISGFTLAQVLRKDNKYSRAGGLLIAVPTVKVQLKDQGVFDSPASLTTFLEEMAASAQAESLDGYFALVKAPHKKKHIVACVPTSTWGNVQTAITSRLAAGDAVYGGILVSGELIPWPVPDAVMPSGQFSFGLFEIDGEASRKQVLPFLEELHTNLSK